MAASIISKRLEELHSKAVADGQWPLAMAARAAKAEEANLDLQINVVGALHEVGQLKNRMEPFLKAWRGDASGWAARCVDRLKTSDRDYWALAAMLGLEIREVWPAFRKAGFNVMSVRTCPAGVTPLTHFVTLAGAKEGPVSKMDSPIWKPVLEIGWDPKVGAITDMARLRAVLFDSVKKKGASFFGKGDGSNFMRAALPHGSWRVVSFDFELVEEAVIPIEKTLLKKA